MGGAVCYVEGEFEAMMPGWINGCDGNVLSSGPAHARELLRAIAATELAEQPLDQLVATKTMMLCNGTQNSRKCADLDRAMLRYGHMVGAVFFGGQTNMTSTLSCYLISQSAKCNDQVIATDRAWKLHAAMTISLTI